MRHQWYKPARGTSGCEPDFVYCNVAQELFNPTHVGEERLALCAKEGRLHE